MNDRELATYLGLRPHEFEALRAASPGAIERYRSFDAISRSLEQLPVLYNKPPKTDDDTDNHLQELSDQAFARLDAAVAVNEAFRKMRAAGEKPRGERDQRRRDRRIREAA